MSHQRRSYLLLRHRLRHRILKKTQILKWTERFHRYLRIHCLELRHFDRCQQFLLHHRHIDLKLLPH